MSLSASSLPKPTLVAAAMLIQNTPVAAIKFFATILPYLETHKRCSCSEMARQYGCTPQAVTKHIRLLERQQLVNRIHYRAWELNTGKIDDLLK